jgi:DnaK suppressor protein
MTKAQVNRFRTTLEAKRNELLREIADRRERMALSSASDPMDMVRNIADRDLTVQHVDRMLGLLRQVDGALIELRVGTFGLCAECGAEIPGRRLEAVPWSPNCVTCQERMETYSRRGNRAEESKDRYALAS